MAYRYLIYSCQSDCSHNAAPFLLSSIYFLLLQHSLSVCADSPSILGCCMCVLNLRIEEYSQGTYYCFFLVFSLELRIEVCTLGVFCKYLLTLGSGPACSVILKTQTYLLLQLFGCPQEHLRVILQSCCVLWWAKLGTHTA